MAQTDYGRQPAVVERPSSGSGAPLPAAAAIAAAGKLKLGSALGHGTFAVVHKATILGQSVAVKILKPEYFNDKTVVDMFLREAATLVKLHHRHIVRCYRQMRLALKKHGMLEAMVLEHVEGPSLSQLLYEQLKSPPKQVYSDADALRWLVQVAEALDYLHSQNPKIVHRDVKPSNVLLGPAPAESMQRPPASASSAANASSALRHTTSGVDGSGLSYATGSHKRLLMQPATVQASTQGGAQDGTSSKTHLHARLCDFGLHQVLDPAEHRPVVRVASSMAHTHSIGLFHSVSMSSDGSLMVPALERAMSRQRSPSAHMHLPTDPGLGTAAEPASTSSARNGLLVHGHGQQDDAGLPAQGGAAARYSPCPSGPHSPVSPMPRPARWGTAPAPMPAANQQSPVHGSALVQAQLSSRRRQSANVSAQQVLNRGMSADGSVSRQLAERLVSAAAVQRLQARQAMVAGVSSSALQSDSRRQSLERGAAQAVAAPQRHSSMQLRELSGHGPAPGTMQEPPDGMLLRAAATRAAAVLASSSASCSTTAPLPKAPSYHLLQQAPPMGSGMTALRRASIASPMGAAQASTSGMAEASLRLQEHAVLRPADGDASPAGTHTPSGSAVGSMHGHVGEDVAQTPAGTAAALEPLGLPPVAGAISWRGSTGGVGGGRMLMDAGSGATVQCPNPLASGASRTLRVSRRSTGVSEQLAELDMAGSASGTLPQPASPQIEAVFPLSGRAGTCVYMAPEVAKEQPYNEKADVFSFGIMAYEVVVRTLISHTKAGRDGYHFTRCMVEGRRPVIPRTVDPRVASLIQRCWHDDPLERPTMAQVVAELQHLQGMPAEACCSSYSASGAMGTAPFNTSLSMAALLRRGSSMGGGAAQSSALHATSNSHLATIALPRTGSQAGYKVEEETEEGKRGSAGVACSSVPDGAAAECAGVPADGALAGLQDPAEVLASPTVVAIGNYCIDPKPSQEQAASCACCTIC